jgi:hypothetical protein
MLLGTLVIAAGSVAVAGGQQSGIQTFGGQQEERSAVRIALWDPQKNSVVGQFAIDYGRPVWKKEYENKVMFDLATKGKVWRLGNNFWTVLDTNVPLKIGGKEIPVGLWYLGLHRAEDGASWSLALIDPAKARSARLDAFEISKAQIEIRAPMSLESTTAPVEKLTISLTPEKTNYRNSMLKIAWGTLQLTAGVQIQIAG